MAYRSPNSAAYFGGERDRLSSPASFSRQQMYSPTGRNYRERDDSQYMGHGGFTEMEGILDKERGKFKDIRENLENELDNERKVRIDFENKLIKLKDEFAKKDLIISELEFRQNNILHDNQDLVMENQKMRSELSRMEQTYSNKIYELEADLAAQTKNLEETTIQYNTEFDKFKKEGQEYIQTLTFEYDRKIKGLEDKLKVSQLSRKDLAFDNKRLNDLLTSSKMNYEQEVRDLTSRMRDQELKKIAMLTKSFEQRVRTLQETKQTLNRKCQEFMKLLQDKDRQIEARQTEAHGELEHLRQEIADQINKNTQMNYMFEKLKAQLLDRDSLLKRYSGEASQETGYLKQQLQQKKKENQQLNIAIRDLRQNVKDLTSEFERKRVELMQRINYSESEARKYKDDYTRLHSSLKTKINETINHFSQVHRG